MRTMANFSSLCERLKAADPKALQPPPPTQFNIEAGELVHPGELMNNLGEEATKCSEILGMSADGTEDGVADAFRHAYASSKVGSVITGPGAQLLGLAHEIHGFLPAYLDSFDFLHTWLASVMDAGNNTLGASLKDMPTNEDLAVRIYLAIAGGQLKVLEKRDLGDGEKTYHLRDTDYRDVWHFEWDKVDPLKNDSPEEDFASDDDDVAWA